jgi:hypothetical protein
LNTELLLVNNVKLFDGESATHFAGLFNVFRVDTLVDTRSSLRSPFELSATNMNMGYETAVSTVITHDETSASNTAGAAKLHFEPRCIAAKASTS